MIFLKMNLLKLVNRNEGPKLSEDEPIRPRVCSENYEDPGSVSDDDGALLPDEGNPYRDVWKVVVWKKLNDERVSVPERAIYAALCGNLEMLLPMCPTWEDQLWAHLKTLVDVATELHLRNARGADLGPLPEDYPKENETLHQILR